MIGEAPRKIKEGVYNLPIDYTQIGSYQRRKVREQYVVEQKGLCMFCKGCLKSKPGVDILEKKIHWDLFPPHFLKYPVHLQHNHKTGMTEGAVHALCNAVLWQHHGR